MLKSRLQPEQTDILLRRFSRLGISPTGWTMMSLVLAAAGCAALVSHHLAFGLIFFAISGFMDMVDGSVARATNSSSAKGAFIDGLLDRYVEMLLFLGLMFYLRPDYVLLLLPVQAWIALLIFGSVMTSFSRAYADHRGLVKDPLLLKKMGGVLERAERLMLLYLGMLLGIVDQKYLAWAIMLAAILSNATVVQRIFFALSYGKKT
jgi:archaetidylinositol phosphate synthase